jgi:hypothetical protein
MGELAALTGGPMDGFWFFAADWQESLTASRNMDAANQRPSPRLNYRDSGTDIRHPREPWTGRAWTWTPPAT